MRGRLLLGLVILVSAVGVVPLIDAPPSAEAAPRPGRIPDGVWKARTDDYLNWATGRGLSQGSVDSILAFAERQRRDPGFTWDANAPDPSDFAGAFQSLQHFDDTGDFKINDYLFAWYQVRDQLRPDLKAAFEERIKAFKYWWTEPTPPGIIDSQYYWTENHLIIFLANEYLAGQAFPDAVFGNSGMTGRQHMAHARPLILRWMSLRARFGWSEWLSNVYMMEDLKGLLLLAEWSDDSDLTTWSSDLLDLMFVELASHLQNGSFGATHGRSYLKDKMTARTEDTFTMAKMVFDDTAVDYQNVDNASLVATAHRYRPPDVARQIARSDQTGVVRQRQGIPIDPHEPISDHPTPAYGLPYDDAMVWWGMGAQFPWQVVPLSVNLINTYDLFSTSNFQPAAALKPIVESSTVPQLQNLALSLATPVNPGLLSEVNTYTWRSPDVMLSSAQDWRKGQRSEQVHVSQATLDADALVFTTHPASPAPLTPAEARSDASAYWTGQASVPRSAQAGRVNISVYAPQYDSQPAVPIPYLRYEQYTHAFFPTEKFDQVVEQDGWVIGRRGDGYVALWSYRPTHWRSYDPGDYTLDLTQRFDLVADGGPDNVWITEVGRKSDWANQSDPFAAFVAAVTGSHPTVTPKPGPGGAPHGIHDGFDVGYASPAEGQMTFGWDAPLDVRGVEQALRDYPRWDSPFTNVGFDTWHYRVYSGLSSLDIDLTPLAVVTGAVPPPSSSTTTPVPSTSATTSVVSGGGGSGGAGGGAGGGSGRGGGSSSGAAAPTAAAVTARPRFTG